MRNMQGLVSFVETATSGSFTAAAARLDITPAAVGKNVTRLEAELQVRLFHRTTRRLKITPEGEAFRAEAADVLQRLDDAVHRVSQSVTEPAGQVRITCGIAYGQRFVLPLLAPITRQHPQVLVDLSLENRNTDLVAEGYDIAIRGGLFDADSSLVVQRLGPLPSVLVASPAYLRRHGVPRTVADLVDGSHRVLGLRFTTGDVARWRFRKPGGRGMMDWTPTARVWTSDPDSCVELAALGEGICQAGLMHAAPLLRSGRLRLVLHDQYDHGSRQMMLCHPSRKLVSRRVRVVLDALWSALSTQADLQMTASDVPDAWRA